MDLPFSTEQFLNVFAGYNSAVWPVQIPFVLLAVYALFLATRKRTWSDRAISAILAFFWLWIGVVYHLIFFSTINGGAYAFGVLYVIQAGVFLYHGLAKGNLSFRYRSDGHGITGSVLILYALVIYPLLGYVLGHVYPQSPTFGLPCPTTIFTFGLLLWTDRRVPYTVLVIPFLWSLIGFSAALNLGIREDIGLLVAGVVATLLLVVRQRKGAL